MNTLNLIAKTPPGLEEVLAREIEAAGGREVKPTIRAVNFTGNLETVYRVNYQSRTAVRILRDLTTFTFRSSDEFYRKCLETDWRKYIDPAQSFAVFSTVSHSEVFRNSMFASLRLKDAIVDFLRSKTGKRPDVNPDNPDIIFHVHVNFETCSIALDSSGESLHKRGYRVAQGLAPLSEVLAAGMILLSGWNGQSDFLDPMCGSGTLPVEAALIAQNIPPGKFRSEFAFERWTDFDSELFEKIKNEIEPVEFKNRIFASDISLRNLNEAKANARSARVYEKITFRCADFNDLNLNLDGATIIINPPYGERLNDKGLTELYDRIGERLKHRYSGNSAWILTSSKELLDKIGLKPFKKVSLVNGSLECRYYGFNLFSGKLKERRD
jgi:putative N6-adenine-specific DNA methylase